jgi:hypothetical protein
MLLNSEMKLDFRPIPSSSQTSSSMAPNISNSNTGQGKRKVRDEGGGVMKESKRMRKDWVRR